MAGNPAGDIPGARYWIGPAVTHASVASNGATAVIGRLTAPHAGRLTKAFWMPTGGNTTGSSTASYRKMEVLVGTVSLASLGLTATKASLSPVAMTVGAAATFAAGDVLLFKHGTVGAAETTSTELAAGQFDGLEYEAL
jgi:hypothetical protein